MLFPRRIHLPEELRSDPLEPTAPPVRGSAATSLQKKSNYMHASFQPCGGPVSRIHLASLSSAFLCLPVCLSSPLPHLQPHLCLPGVSEVSELCLSVQHPFRLCYNSGSHILPLFLSSECANAYLESRKESLKVTLMSTSHFYSSFAWIIA